MRLPAPAASIKPQRSRFLVTSLAALVAAAVLPVVSSAPAAAAPTSGVTPPTTTQASSHSGTATTLSGMTVADPNSAQELQVEVSTTLGTLTLPTTSGLSLGFGNSWSGQPSVSFSGVASDVNAALAAARLVGTGTPGSATVSITSMHKSNGYVYSAPNQHFYEYVPSAGITWTAARSAAKLRSYKGQQGYLATMPTPELNDFVSQRIEGAQNVWFGATAVANPVSGVARRWTWADGPLSGRAFTECSNAAGACTVVNDSGRYSSWAISEPNNSGNTETAAVSNWNGTVGRWNDLSPTTTTNAIGGYVVEYGDEVQGTTTPFTDFYRASSTVSLADVPAAHGAPSVAPGDRKLTATLVAPDDGGSALTKYVVTATPVGGGNALTESCLAPATTCAVTGLQNGTAYDVTVVVHNDRGSSAASAATRSTPVTHPGAPTDVAAIPLDGYAAVTFSAPEDDGGTPITEYRVYSQPATTGVEYTTCTSSPCEVDATANGTSYTFTVVARNSAGDSEESVASDPVVPFGFPFPPTNASVVPGNSSATVSFSPPSSSNGSPITGYSVNATRVGGTTPITVTCDASPCEVGGLTNGTMYRFTVRAINARGSSGWINAGIVTPATTPEAPGAVTATRGDESITLAFAAPASNGGSAITRYEYSTDGGQSWQTLATTSTPPGLTGTVTGLTNGISYSVEVRAVNAVGESPATVASAPAVPATAPEAPAVGEVIAGDRSATVSFTTPLSNGDAITSYTVTAAPDGASVTCATSPCEVTGLANGTSYTFSVVATNTVGDSAASPASSPAVPFAAPDAPTGLATTSQDESALLELTPPAFDGGRSVTSYLVSVDGGDWVALATSPVAGGRLMGLVTGLTNGSTHSLRVAAVNEAGTGAASEPEDVVPAGPASAPRQVTVGLNGLTATVSWAAPTDDGGAPVTEYLVTSQPDGMTCTALAPALSCEVTGLHVGTDYTFSVVAINGASTLSGTGPGEAGQSGPSTVTATPGAPSTATGVPGDRVLTVRWQAPSNSGTSVVQRYQVSLDGGATWRAVTTTGTTELSTTLTGVRNGRAYPVRIRAVNADGPGAALGIHLDTQQWFADPLSTVERSRLVTAPKAPERYRGAVRRTTAWGKASGGSPAMSLNRLRGGQLQSGQAATLFDRNMFRFNRATLTSYGRNQLRAMVASLTYVDAIRCEGHVDYGGADRRANVLAKKRAEMACRVLLNYGADVTTATKGFGNRVPVIIGGRGHEDRWANRRVVVTVTKG